LAVRLAALARGVETMALGPERLEVMHARVGTAWYPAGSGPRPAAGDAMLAGAARERR
jgi:hypothetical protein